MMQDADVYYCTKDKLGVSQITDLGAQPIDVSDPVSDLFSLRL